METENLLLRDVGYWASFIAPLKIETMWPEFLRGAGVWKVSPTGIWEREVGLRMM